MPNPILTKIDQDLSDLRTQINHLEAKRISLAREPNRRKRLSRLYREHGFSSNDEFIAYLRSVTPRTQAEQGLRHGRAFSPELIEKLKQAIVDGKTAAQVKESLGVSAPSFYIWKKRWGLTRVYAKRPPVAQVVA